MLVSAGLLFSLSKQKIFYREASAAMINCPSVTLCFKGVFIFRKPQSLKLLSSLFLSLQAEVSFEDGTSFSGNSNNVFTTGGSEMIQASNASNSQNQQPMFTVSFDDSYGNEDPFFPIFDNTILIDPIQRQREHFGQQHQHPTAAVFSAPQRSIVRHNCLNHHPYGTFYYSKKSGRTGRHCPPPVPPRDLPNSPVLNSHHHTVMAGGFFGRNSNNNSAESNVR